MKYKYQTIKDIEATEEYKNFLKNIKENHNKHEIFDATIWICNQLCDCKQFYDEVRRNYFDFLPEIHEIPYGTFVKFDMSEVNSER